MQKIRGKRLKEYKSRLHLSEKQKAMIIGSALGDGSLRIIRRNLEANFIIDHGEEQKDYVFWKYKIMKEWVLTPPKQVERIYHKDRERKTISWRFSTISHSEISEIYRIFYPNGKKIIPQSIKELISPLALAVWLMDDGTKSGKSFFISSQSFNREEQERLLDCLKANFDIEGRINVHSYSQGETLFRIRINSNSLRKLYQSVEPNISPQFCYKFSLYPCNDLPLKRRVVGTSKRR